MIFWQGKFTPMSDPESVMHPISIYDEVLIHNPTDHPSAVPRWQHHIHWGVGLGRAVRDGHDYYHTSPSPLSYLIWYNLRRFFLLAAVTTIVIPFVSQLISIRSRRGDTKQITPQKFLFPLILRAGVLLPRYVFGSNCEALLLYLNPPFHRRSELEAP